MSHNTASSSLTKDILITYIVGISKYATGFICIPIFARILGPYQWGLFTLNNQIITIMSTAALLGLGVSMGRFIPMAQERESKKPLKYVSTGLIISILSVLFISISSFILCKYFLPYLFKDKALISVFRILLLSFIFSTLFNFFQNVYRGYRRFNFYNIVSFTRQISILIIPLIFILVINKDAFSLGLGTSLAAGLTCFLSFIFIQKRIINLFQPPHFGKNTAKELLIYGVPRIPGSFLLGLLSSFSVFVLGNIFSIEEVGQFSIAIKLVMVLGGSVEALGIVFLPVFSALIGKKDEQSIENYLNIIISFLLYFFTFIALEMLIFTRMFMLNIFGSQYEMAIVPMKILIISILFTGIYGFLRNYINAYTVRPINVINIAISLIINIALSLMLIPRFGMSGAAVATSISFFILGLLSFLYVNKIHKFKIKILQLKELIFLLLIVGSFSLVIHYVINNFLKNLISMIIGALVILTLYILLLYKLDINWFNKLSSSLLKIFETYLKKPGK